MNETYMPAARMTCTERAADARNWFAQLEPLPTAAELVAPILEALRPLHDMRDRVEAHQDIIEAAEFIEVTAEEWAQAEALLALQHRIIDLIAGEFDGWVTADEVNPAPAIRQAVSTAMNLDRLSHVVTWVERSRLAGGNVNLKAGAA